MKRLYYGVATMHVCSPEGAIRLKHAFTNGLFGSEDEATGACVRHAREAHPSGTLCGVAAYQVPDETVLEAARLITAETAASGTETKQEGR